jgi:hypothetical protein
MDYPSNLETSLTKQAVKNKHKCRYKLQLKTPKQQGIPEPSLSMHSDPYPEEATDGQQSEYVKTMTPDNHHFKTADPLDCTRKHKTKNQSSLIHHE